MKQPTLTIVMALTIFALLLAACAAASPAGQTPVVTQPTTLPNTTPIPANLPEPLPTPGTKPEIVFDPSDPLSAIKKFLYANYGILPGDVRLVEQQEREWSDSCLGLGGPAELCMTVITPGFLVTVDTPQGTFTFHTAVSLDRFRLAEGVSGGLPGRFDPVARFQWLLAGRLNIPFDQVTVISKDAVDWPDACLGVSEPGFMCAAVITPGFRLTLSTPQGEVVIHTDANLSTYRTPQPLPGLDRPLLGWERSGGIAGICERMVIGFDGAYQVTDCRNDTILFEGVVDVSMYEQLIGHALTYSATTWKFEPPAGSADMFVDGFTFNGQGEQVASAIEQEKLNDFFSNLLQFLKTQPTNK